MLCWRGLSLGDHPIELTGEIALGSTGAKLVLDQIVCLRNVLDGFLCNHSKNGSL